MDNKIIEKLDMSDVFRQKQLLIDLGAAVRKDGHNILADELEAIIGVLDVVQDEAENAGYFTFPEYDDSTGKVVYDCDYYNDVLQEILNDEESHKKYMAEQLSNKLEQEGKSKNHYYMALRPLPAALPNDILTKFEMDTLRELLNVDIEGALEREDLVEVAAPSVEYFLRRNNPYAATCRYQETHGCSYSEACDAVIKMYRKTKKLGGTTNG